MRKHTLTDSSKTESPGLQFGNRATFDWWATARLLFLVAIAVFLLLLATTPGPLDFDNTLRTLLTTFVYTFFIGTTALYVISQVIEPLTFQSETVTWSLVVLCSLGLTVVGAAVAEMLLIRTGLFPGQTFSGRFISGLKIALIVSTAVATARYTYNRMRHRLQSRNVELQKTIEIDSVRVRRQEEDLQKAREIQQGLLPKNIPQVLGYEVTGIWQPALSVSGDYYDVLPLSDSSLGIVIADVVGKGISAALLMANLQATVRAFATDGRTPAEVCERINAIMCNNVAPGKFITLFYGVLDGARRQLTYSNAGHNPPILVREGSTSRLKEGGALLGVFPDWKYEQCSIDLHASDRILLFTDGLSEVEDVGGHEFGEERLVEILQQVQNLPAAEIQTLILGKVRDFCRGIFQDDATLIVIAVT